MSAVEIFCETFIEKDIRLIIDKYDAFRQKAILEEGLYLDLKEELEGFYNHYKARDEWKNQVYQKFAELVTVCEGYKKRGIELERSRELNEKLINTFIIDPIDEILGNLEWQSDIKIKYGMIHLLLDVIYSYCDPVRKMHFSAVVCDKIADMGEQNPEIKRFYGKEAEENIVAYALDTIEFICKKEKRDVKDYIQQISNTLTQRFSKEFCGKLLELYREQETERNRKKGQGMKVVNLAEESYEQTKIYGQTNSYPKDEKIEEKEQKEQKENRIKYLLIILSGIIAAVVLLTAGIWIGKNKNTKTQENTELQKRIELLEEQQKQQSEQIKTLKDIVESLEVELRMLEQEDIDIGEIKDIEINPTEPENGEIENLDNINNIEEPSEKESESTGLTSN